ncbi:MAG: hypothetical protein MUE68_08975 [Bacteroidetes bacterium]|jgi:hypothetical protein|nr:hypothetical protein [Bacteroidota bacterium]
MVLHVGRAQSNRTGSLIILADSGVTVYLDGQYYGMIRSAEEGLEIVELRPATYAVVLPRSGSASEEFKVEVKRGQKTTLDKRAFRTVPVPEAFAPAVRPAPQAVGKDTAGGVTGTDRFVGLWREQRTGTFGNAHFNITLKDGKFFVQRTRDDYPTDQLTPFAMTDRTSGRSFGVVRLNGKVGHFGGSASMSLMIHAVVRDPTKDLNSDTLAVEYQDYVGGGAKLEGSPRGLWVRMKR